MPLRISSDPWVASRREGAGSIGSKVGGREGVRWQLLEEREGARWRPRGSGSDVSWMRRIEQHGSTGEREEKNDDDVRRGEGAAAAATRSRGNGSIARVVNPSHRF